MSGVCTLGAAAALELLAQRCLGTGPGATSGEAASHLLLSKRQAVTSPRASLTCRCETCCLSTRVSARQPRRRKGQGRGRPAVLPLTPSVLLSRCSGGLGPPQCQFPRRKQNPLHVDPGHIAALRAGRAEDLRPQVPRLRSLGSPLRVTRSFGKHPNPVFLAPQARGRPHRHRHLRGGGRGEAERLQGSPGRAGPARRHGAGLRPERGAREQLLR